MRRAELVLILAAGACKPTAEPEPPLVPDAPKTCQPGELTRDDGSCQPAGVPAEACGEGFESDGALGCRAILPAEPCAPGEIALPGDAACRPLVDCASGDWGAIAVESNTQHVKASYAGSDSDGSAARPWTTIAEAVAAAEPGAIVAVAEGSYVGDVSLDQRVRLWGRCPERVEIVGTGSVTALWVRAAGSEVRGLAVRGAVGGLLITAEDVVVEGLWAHDTGWHGIHVESYQGPASAEVQSALVEHATAFGVYVFGAALTIRDVAVRDTRLDAGAFGYGVHVENVEGGERGTLDLAHAVVESSYTIGIGNVGSDLSITSTLVRDTLPTPAGLVGRGINAEDNPFTGAPATLAIDATVVERSHDMGIYIAGVTGSISHTVVRDTFPEAASQEFGRALNILADYDNGVASDITVKSSLFERSYDSAVAVFGSPVDAELIVIRTTGPEQSTQMYGYGLLAQHQSGMRASVALRASVVEDSRLFGIVALASDIDVATSRISRTSARADGLYGDGISARVIDGQPGTAYIGPGTLVADSDRAGISAFGSAVTMGATVLECNPIDFHTETWDGVTTTLEDAGDNRCRCSASVHDCKASSITLEPPDPLPSN